MGGSEEVTARGRVVSCNKVMVKLDSASKQSKKRPALSLIAESSAPITAIHEPLAVCSVIAVLNRDQLCFSRSANRFCIKNEPILDVTSDRI